MQTVTSGDAVLHVQTSGPINGPVVMFANSLGTDMRVWDPLLPFLPEGLRVVRYDKRGHGLSDCPAAPYDMGTLVQDAAAIIDALALTDVTFVGLSIGGLIGQGLAAARPEQLRALVLMDTAAKIGEADMWQTRIAALRADGIAAMADAILDRWFASVLRNDPVALAPWKHMLTRTPLAGYIGCCAAIADADFTSSTAALKLPILAMAGAEDGATPPDVVRATAALCGAAFHVLPDAGHLPCVEQPAQVARLIVEFIKENKDV